MTTNTDQTTETPVSQADKHDSIVAAQKAAAEKAAADKPKAAPKKKAAKKAAPKKKAPTAPREGTKLRKFFDKARTAKGVDAAASRAIYGYDGGLWITITQLATQFGLVGAKYQDGRKCSYRLLKPGQSTAKAKEVFKPGKAA